MESGPQDSCTEHSNSFTIVEAKTGKLLESAGNNKHEKFHGEQETEVRFEPTTALIMPFDPYGPYGGTSSRKNWRLPSNDGSHRKLRRRKHSQGK